MFNKIKRALKKCKSVFIILAILWVTLSIVFVAPCAASWVDAFEFGQGQFIDVLVDQFGDIGGNLSKALSKDYITCYLRGELYLTIFLFFCAAVGIVKTLPKHDYSDIEHGSSDWADGDEYSVLNRNKGIILAEKHYLPVDKRGNVNVLVVGRFWFW